MNGCFLFRIKCFLSLKILITVENTQKHNIAFCCFRPTGRQASDRLNIVCRLLIGATTHFVVVDNSTYF